MATDNRIVFDGNTTGGIRLSSIVNGVEDLKESLDRLVSVIQVATASASPVDNTPLIAMFGLTDVDPTKSAADLSYMLSLLQTKMTEAVALGLNRIDKYLG